MTDNATSSSTCNEPDFQAVVDAGNRLSGHAVHTPLLQNQWLNTDTGREVWLKPESLQHSGSFKFRGAFNRLIRLSPQEQAAGVIAWSSGNHAQGVALAARQLGIKARIVMPADAPVVKRENTERLGAEVIPYDRASEDREAIAYALAAQDGGVIVPSYDDPDIIAGQGTVALEVFRDLAQREQTVDALLVCCSGGGLVAGCALAAEGLSPQTAVFTVEPEHHDDHRRSLESGHRERNASSAGSFCDALLAPTPGELTFAINQRLLAGGLVVSDAEVAHAMRYAFNRLKLVIEPGGAVALAALLAGKVPEQYQRVGIVLSGGNVDADVFARVLANQY